MGKNSVSQAGGSAAGIRWVTEEAVSSPGLFLAAPPLLSRAAERQKWKGAPDVFHSFAGLDIGRSADSQENCRFH